MNFIISCSTLKSLLNNKTNIHHYTPLLVFIEKNKCIPVLDIDLVIIKKNTRNKQNKQHDV